MPKLYPSSETSTCVALAAQVFSAETQAAPDWIHLLPAGPSVPTVPGDPRGPFEMTDPKAVIAASMAGGPLPIDENHATDFAAQYGTPSPARGWITELELRADGIWGKVDWTEEGRALVESRAYRAISPVIGHPKKNSPKITAILRAAIVNNPGLAGLTTLHMEQHAMALLQRLATLLGLGEDADEDAVVAAVEKMAGGEDDSAMSAEIEAIATALGCDAGADHATILAAATAAKGDADSEGTIATALREDLTKVTTELAKLKGDRSREKAEDFVDAAIREGRAGINQTSRDDYISLFMSDEKKCRTIIETLPVLGGSAPRRTGPPPKSGETTLSAEQADVVAMLGLDPNDVAKTLKAEEV